MKSKIDDLSFSKEALCTVGVSLAFTLGFPSIVAQLHLRDVARGGARCGTPAWGLSPLTIAREASRSDQNTNTQGEKHLEKHQPIPLRMIVYFQT